MATLNLDMKLKYRAIHAKKLKNMSDAFFLLLTKWDENRLENYKEAKAIFLNNKKEAIGICDIPADKNDFPIERRGNLNWQVTPVFRKAQMKNATAVIIAQSRLPEDIFPDDHRVKLFEQYSSTASNFDIKLEDLISMGSTTWSSIGLQATTK